MVVKTRAYFVFAFVALMLFSAFVVPLTYAVSEASMFRSDSIFTVNPDGSIGVEAVGEFRSVVDGDYSPLTVASLNFESTRSGDGLTKFSGGFAFWIDPSYSILLSGMGMEVKLHGDEVGGKAEIHFSLPGFISVDGSVNGVGIGSTDLDFDLSATVWYSTLPREAAEDLVASFPAYREQLISQVSEAVGGDLVVEELNLVESSFGDSSVTLRITGRVTGDAYSVFTSMLENVDESVASGVEELKSINLKSCDLSVTYDSSKFVFMGDFDGIFEGEVDELINILMGSVMAQDGQTHLMEYQAISDLVNQSVVSVTSLDVAFDLTLSEGVLEGRYNVEGLVFKPLTLGIFSNGLNEALGGVSLPDSTLTLLGGADADNYVEVVISSDTSKPVDQGLRKATWNLDGLVGLEKVTFMVRGWPTPTVSLGEASVVTGNSVKIEGRLTQEEKPLPGTVLTIYANGDKIGTTQTDGDGFYTYAYEFEKAGSYEVKTSVGFEGVDLESQTATVKVEDPPLVPPSLLLPLFGVGLIIAVIVGFLMIRK